MDKKGRGMDKSAQSLSPEAIDAKIEALKLEMKVAARELRFEEAARMRDEVKQLTELRFML
jgi:excinuclease ABC subunit B